MTRSTYDRLREGIVNGKYPPASRLVNRSLAEELGVSVVPVREALGRLSSEGVVEHIPGAGSFVRSLDNRSLAKLYALREQLEVFAVREAALNAQAYQIQMLHRCCETMTRLLADMEAEGDTDDQKRLVEDWIAADAAFHSFIIEAADNEWLGMAVERLRVLAHIAQAKQRDLASVIYDNALKEHRAIARAVEDRDAENAEAMMRKHIQRAKNAVLTGIAEHE